MDTADFTAIAVQTKIIEVATRERIFRYEVARISDQCWTITALHTGATRQYSNPIALWAFVADLQGHLVEVYGRPDGDPDPTPTTPAAMVALPAPQIAGLLPAPRQYGYFRAIRLTLLRMIGDVVQQIASGDVIALGAPDMVGQAVRAIHGKRVWYSGEAVWIDGSHFAKETDGAIRLYGIKPGRSLATIGKYIGGWQYQQAA